MMSLRQEQWATALRISDLVGEINTVQAHIDYLTAQKARFEQELAGLVPAPPREEGAKEPGQGAPFTQFEEGKPVYSQPEPPDWIVEAPRPKINLLPEESPDPLPSPSFAPDQEECPECGNVGYHHEECIAYTGKQESLPEPAIATLTEIVNRVESGERLLEAAEKAGVALVEAVAAEKEKRSSAKSSLCPTCGNKTSLSGHCASCWNKEQKAKAAASLPENFTEKLKEAVAKQFVYQGDAAKALGIGKPTMSAYLNGTSIPSGRQLASLQRVFPSVFGTEPEVNEQDSGQDQTLPEPVPSPAPLETPEKPDESNNPAPVNEQDSVQTGPLPASAPVQPRRILPFRPMTLSGWGKDEAALRAAVEQGIQEHERSFRIIKEGSRFFPESFDYQPLRGEKAIAKVMVRNGEWVLECLPGGLK